MGGMNIDAAQRSAAPDPTYRPRPRPAVNVLLWILQVVTALAFAVAALGKFTGSPEMVATFHSIELGDWFRYLVGALELAGAVAMFVPRLTGLAALCLAALLVGALMVQVFVVGSGAAAPVPLLVVSTLIAWGRWGSTRRLLGRSA